MPTRINPDRATRPFRNPAVQAVFENYPPGVRDRLLLLRELIFEVAAETEGVGELQETLKWGQPSYLTSKTGSGTTIRIDQAKSQAGNFVLYVHCQTSLLDTFRELYPKLFHFEGNRAIVFHQGDELPIGQLRHCIALALTYHQRKKG